MISCSFSGSSEPIDSSSRLSSTVAKKQKQKQKLPPALQFHPEERTQILLTLQTLHQPLLQQVLISQVQGKREYRAPKARESAGGERRTKQVFRRRCKRFREAKPTFLYIIICNQSLKVFKMKRIAVAV